MIAVQNLDGDIHITSKIQMFWYSKQETIMLGIFGRARKEKIIRTYTQNTHKPNKRTPKTIMLGEHPKPHPNAKKRGCHRGEKNLPKEEYFKKKSAAQIQLGVLYSEL